MSDKKNNKESDLVEIPEINKRFMSVLDHYNYTGYKMEKEETGISQVQVSHIKTGRNKPSNEVLQLLKSKFPDINYFWLLEGKGEMLKPSQEEINQLYRRLNTINALELARAHPYEYEVITYDNLDQGAQENFINEKAFEGWELVTASYMVDTDGTKCFRFFFRRKLG
ncbi:hypothetical protein CMU68_09985 [Elizabethkingia anophelis]|uniref:hypothetical protein n=1 Tax=Elizabethkingia anophelis TaxID=1117645 RepID=UPI00293CA049|nr:hypothetical protein [Elizabethkingia anophelis]MDV3786264.1 hypothetical protein [Elizabethkingia anophelis]